MARSPVADGGFPAEACNSFNHQRCKCCHRPLRHGLREDLSGDQPLRDPEMARTGEALAFARSSAPHNMLARTISSSSVEAQTFAFSKAKPPAARVALGRTATNILGGWRSTTIQENKSVISKPRVEPSLHDLKKYQAIYNHGIEMQQRKDARMQKARHALIDKEMGECYFQPATSVSQFKDRYQDLRPHPGPLPQQQGHRSPASQSTPDLRTTSGPFTKVTKLYIHGDPQYHHGIRKLVIPPYACGQ